MSFQVCLDNTKAKTGKSSEDFRILAAEKGLTQYREIMAWLKSDFGLGHGHANAIRNCSCMMCRARRYGRHGQIIVEEICLKNI